MGVETFLHNTMGMEAETAGAAIILWAFLLRLAQFPLYEATVKYHFNQRK